MKKKSRFQIFSKLSIRKKLYLLLGIQVLILLTCFFLVTYFMLHEEVKKNRASTMQIAEKLSDLFQSHYSIVVHGTVFPILRDSNGMTSTIYRYFSENTSEDDFPFSVTANFESTVFDILNMNREISNIGIFNCAGKGFFMKNDNIWGKASMVKLDMSQEWIKEAMKIKGSPSLVFSLPETKTGFPGSDEQIYCTRAIVNAERYEVIGMVLAGFSKSILTKAFQSTKLFPSQSFAIFSNDYSQVICKSENFPLESLAQIHFTPKERIGKNHMTWFANPMVNVIIATPTTSLYKTITVFSIILILFTTILIILTIYFSMHIAKSIEKPVTSLIESISHYSKGEFTHRITFEGKNELTIIGNALNEMADKINNLINEVYKSSLEKKKFELQILKNQINSHFLYNSLDSARMTAFLNNDSKVVDILTHLANLLRYGLVTSNEPVPLRTELSNIDDYIKISNLRSLGNIEISTSIEDACDEVLLPRITLQPIIENAIKHGFEKGQQNGTIFILGFVEDGFCNINITDNGKGIDAQKLVALSKMITEDDIVTHDQRADNIGLKNVNRRLTLFFGTQYSMQIKSVQGKGFSLILTIPME